MLSLSAVFSPPTARADWEQGDGHKMHWPQLPDETGWDVNCTEPLILADDFRCTATGPITGIHFWASWKANAYGTITNIHVSIHEDIPDPEPQNPETFSMPGKLLWSADVTNFVQRPMEPSPQGWWDPMFPPPVEDDHTVWFQVNIALPVETAFVQTSNTIYWLDIRTFVSGGGGMAGQALAGWKTSASEHFLDDAVWGEEDPASGEIVWHELRDPQGVSVDLAFVINGPEPETPPPGEGGQVKWHQALDERHARDLASHWGGPAGTEEEFYRFVLDDFVSDGRPITRVRWWGSYLGYLRQTPGPVPPPPPPERVPTFYADWWTDLAADDSGNPYGYSVPLDLIRSDLYPTADWGVTQLVAGTVVERYATSIWHEAEAAWEHEFVYDLLLPEPWNEKEGTVYWFGAQAFYDDHVPTGGWGWATSPLPYGWNDDAVLQTNLADVVPFHELHYDELWPEHPYGTNSVAMAFTLYSDVIGRRTAKWSQKPDMTFGENMPSFATEEHLEVPGLPLRADDWLCDGRPVTDIHWWGSYLGWLPDGDPEEAFPRPPSAVLPHIAPLGFRLSWHDDIPQGPNNDYSMPSNPPLRELFVPLQKCHEVFYGTVFQWWKEPPIEEHEYQYYVDLLDPELEGGGPWLEEEGRIYWLNVRAVFPAGWQPGAGAEEFTHEGWGWKSTFPTSQWNDVSVVATNYPPGRGPSWEPGLYPPGHPYSDPPLPLDLAFEITTDEGGTNAWWYQPIVLTDAARDAADVHRLTSAGVQGTGPQILQFCTNLMTSNWTDVATNPVPVPPAWLNFWQHPPAQPSNVYYRIRQ
jgi:hypothetical protein